MRSNWEAALLRVTLLPSGVADRRPDSPQGADRAGVSGADSPGQIPDYPVPKAISSPEPPAPSPALPCLSRPLRPVPPTEARRNQLARARGGVGWGRACRRGDVWAEAHATCGGLEAGGHGKIRRAEDAG